MTRQPLSPALVLLVACVAQFMLLVDDTIVNVALPTIGDDLGFSDSTLSWVVNAYLVTFGGFLLVGGRLADRFGARRLFALALAGFATASALCGLAPTDEVLVVARAAQGIAAALLSPAALAILLATHPEGAERRRALAIWASLMAGGAAFGLLVGGAVVASVSWRFVFLINLPVALLALGAVRGLPAVRNADARAIPNAVGATLGTGALLALVFTVVETDDAGWTSARTLGSLAAIAVAFALFAISERRAASPLLPGALLRRPVAMTANALVLLAAGGLLAMFFFLSLYLQQVLGFGAFKTGAAFLPFSITMGLTSQLAARLVAGRPLTEVARIVFAGMLAAGAGLLVLSGIGPDTSYWGHVAMGLVLVAFGMGLAFVPILALSTGDAEERDGGLASGMLTSFQQIGGAIGIAVLVTIASSAGESSARDGALPLRALSDGFDAAFRVQAGVIAVAGVLGLVLFTRLGSRERRGTVATAGPLPAH